MPETFCIEPLSGAHNRAGFSCGSAPLDRYFKEQAFQDVKRRIATCFVAVSSETGTVAGFYTLAATCVALSSLDAAVVKKLPRYPVVLAALIGRLAIAKEFQGRGLGSVLLGDAIIKTARTELGVFAMIVDAQDEAAERFYERFGFTPLPGEARRLCLAVATAVQALNQSASAAVRS